MKKLFLMLVACALLAVCACAENLLQNSGFEEEYGANWIRTASASFAAVQSFDTQVKRSGEKSYCVTLNPEGVANQRAMISLRSGYLIPVQADKFYRLSGWVKTQDFNSAAQLDVYYYSDNTTNAFVSASNRTAHISGECGDWTKFNVPIYSPRDPSATYIGIRVNVGNTSSTGLNGKIWFDDLGLEEVEIVRYSFNDAIVSLTEGESANLPLTGYTADGEEIDLSGITSYSSSDSQIASVSEGGCVTAYLEGNVRISAQCAGQSYFADINVIAGKQYPSLYSPQMRETARRNIARYSWANTICVLAKNKANSYLNLDLKSMVTTQELPRGITVGYTNDPNAWKCRYCGENLQAYAGSYPWLSDPINQPFKIQCPSCCRLFPSNDFASFYAAGIDEDGNFSYERAKALGSAYLENVLYPEKGSGWGVDDGYGYRTGQNCSNGVAEVHTYIAYYNHYGLWYPSGKNPGVLQTALNAFRDAFLYTGEEKYSSAGIELLNRIAEVYPSFKLYPYRDFYNSHGGSYYGKIVGRIWETSVAENFVRAYDAFYPNMPKSVKTLCEDNLLREVYTEVKARNIYGNFGMHQQTLSAAAIALDKMPESGEWIDYVMSSDGGNVLPTIVGTVDRDGFGAEAAVGYNAIWLNETIGIADTLNGYDRYEAGDLYRNPKFVKMFSAYYPLIMCGRYTAQIGDSGATGNPGITGLTLANAIKGYINTGSPILAKLAYFLNGNSSVGLRGDVFTENPESIAASVQSVIDEKGALVFDSRMLTGYGFSILRDTDRDFWMYFGRNTGHGHRDTLNLGVHCFGLDLAPDLGYPETAGSHPNRIQWVSNTISHNTVVVNSDKQESSYIGKAEHFDVGKEVSVMDVDAPGVYSDTSIYRRTVVMVRVSDDVSYAVDFFRVKGGNSHIYSFHANSDTAPTVTGASLTAQSGGTYAGANVQYGADSDTGFSWLSNVSRAANAGSFAVDFKIKDSWNVLKQTRDIHLKLHSVNSFASELAICDGTPPRTPSNPNVLKYMLAKRTGTALDSLFTTVIEPYENSAYIDRVDNIPMIAVSGVVYADDVARAVRITMGDRVDYVVYASNPNVTYSLGGKYTFKGFVGVFGGTNYVLGGDELTGSVTDFTRELSENNTITISPSRPIAASALEGKYIDIDTSSERHAIYRINSATALQEQIVLDIGDVTPINGFINNSDVLGGYKYDFAAGASFKIPLSTDGNAEFSVEGENLYLNVVDSVNALFVFASYSGKKQLSALSAPAVFSSGKHLVDIPDELDTDGADCVKVFLLKSASSPAPLCKEARLG